LSVTLNTETQPSQHTFLIRRTSDEIEGKIISGLATRSAVSFPETDWYLKQMNINVTRICKAANHAEVTPEHKPGVASRTDI
jgi:hypothetical protein